ncbi:hypothetical protein Tdes44962_MAKER09062 [Teratosphaeria destructans]|uniref:Uncharacterized protein n=1 Tax=Teratosphaeria destructans TaxID=418781 RepID=A0A9W7W3G6_9PEZI|nr:hypothetical protein Tdes44962_MAKER09062 [Teratosphaeria destructans]
MDQYNKSIAAYTKRALNKLPASSLTQARRTQPQRSDYFGPSMVPELASHQVSDTDSPSSFVTAPEELTPPTNNLPTSSPTLALQPDHPLPSNLRRPSPSPFDLSHPAGSTTIRRRAVIASERAWKEACIREQAQVAAALRQGIGRMTALEVVLEEGARDMEAYARRAWECGVVGQEVRWRAVDWEQAARGPGVEMDWVGPRGERGWRREG